jgi:hypothetical protein
MKFPPFGKKSNHTGNYKAYRNYGSFRGGFFCKSDGMMEKWNVGILGIKNGIAPGLHSYFSGTDSLCPMFKKTVRQKGSRQAEYLKSKIRNPNSKINPLFIIPSKLCRHRNVLMTITTANSKRTIYARL